MANNHNDATDQSEMRRNADICANCGKNGVYSKGLCEPCYKAQWYQEKKASMPLNLPKRPIGRPPISGGKTTECSDCVDKRVYARGLCYKCYKRAYQQGNVTAEGVDAAYKRPRTIDPVTGKKKTCSYCGLDSVYAHGLCRNCHARKIRNGGDPAYKNRSGKRVMKSRQLLKEQRRLQEDK